MTLQNLFEWFVNNIGIWIIAFLAGWKIIESIRDQRIGKAIVSFAIGGASVYFLKNPTVVLNSISNILANVFK